MAGSVRRFRARTAVLAVLWVALVAISALPMRVEAISSARLKCTFTVKYPIISIRSGPGQQNARIGFARAGQQLSVTDQDVGEDGYVWWQVEQGWVRSDLGISDCPPTCGNTVCEYGETVSSCAQDCQNAGRNLRSTGQGCVVPDCQSCYQSISCYPACSECNCWLNEFGCATCYCRYPGSSATGDALSTSAPSGCTYASCEACYAAFPCWPEPCTKKECTLNEFGCPVCSTSQ
jgi:hypothetical protein